MAPRNPVKFAEGQAHRAEILQILERFGWREPLARMPSAKTIARYMTCDPPLSIRTVRWHAMVLRDLERVKLQQRQFIRAAGCCNIPTNENPHREKRDVFLKTRFDPRHVDGACKTD